MIAAALLAAVLAADAGQPVFEASIELAEHADAYRLRLDDAMTTALGASSGATRVDVIDSLGLTMPRGRLSSVPPPAVKESTDIPLTLSAPTTRDVEPTDCRRDPDGEDCAFYQPPPARLPRGVGQFNPGAGSGSTRGMSGGALGTAHHPGVDAVIAQDDLNRVPLVFSIVTTELPAQTLHWSKPALVLHWKSPLDSQEITWQVGRNVARVTDADRALLASSQGGKNILALRSAWLRNGRFDLFGHVKAVETADGEWEATVPIDWSTGAETLEIGSAPPDAVRSLTAHVQTEWSTHFERPTRQAMTLASSGTNAWHIEGDWPKSIAGVEIEIDPKQALALRDAGIEHIEYTLSNAKGERKMALWATMRSTYAPYQTKETWDELRVDGAPDGFGAPNLFARYYAADIWFENRGTPPYRVRVGALSARTAGDEPSPSTAALFFGRNGVAANVPWAELGPVRAVGEIADPRRPEEIKKDRDRRYVLLASCVAALLVALLAMVDLVLARRLAEREARR